MTDISDDLQISQFYDPVSQTNSDLIISGAQDNGTLLMNGLNFWSAVRGGDGMENAIDPTNPNTCIVLCIMVPLVNQITAV